MEKISAEVVSRAIISMLRKNKAEYLLGDIIQLLKKENVMDSKVVVKTPDVLNDDQKHKAEKFVKGLIRQENFTIEYQIDPRIIDGIQVRFNDKLWDMSLEKQLNVFLEDLK